MDPTTLLHALILGIVEGLTEFLPVSSTGHLILAGDLLHFNDEIGKVFEIVIQFGAILAVVWEYRAKIARVVLGLPHDREAQRFTLNLAIAFMPAAVLGLLFHKAITAQLFQPLPVARAFIIGGLLFGLSRRAATEFSFFLAIPTMTAATFYQLYSGRALLSANDIGMFATGFIAAFVSAFLCVRWLLRYISSHDFTSFAWYRIAFGAVVILTWRLGLVDWSSP